MHSILTGRLILNIRRLALTNPANTVGSELATMEFKSGEQRITTELQLIEGSASDIGVESYNTSFSQLARPLDEHSVN